MTTEDFRGPPSERAREGTHHRQTCSPFSDTTRGNAGKVTISVDRSILDCVWKQVPPEDLRPGGRDTCVNNPKVIYV